MSRFLVCFEIILGHEGGLSDHAADRGGRTNYGVTQKTYNLFRRSHGLAARPVDDITREEVEAIYGEYWRDAKCSYMPEPLDLLMFDAAINHGAGRAVKLLQLALGVDDDGVAGRETMNAVHEEIVAGSVEQLCNMYLDMRMAFYDDIIERDPRQAVFANGWTNRVDHLRELVETA